MYGEQFISKVLDEQDVHAFDRLGVTAELLSTVPERQAMEFILQYAADYGGECPDFRTVESEIEGFTYIPEVTDSMKYLADQIKEYAGLVMIDDLWHSKEVAKMFQNKKKDEFIEEIVGKLQDIQQKTMANRSVGFRMKRDIDLIMTEYEKRKDGESFKIWRSSFATMNETIGGYMSSNVYVWFGRSGRGKSVFTMMESITAAMQGATVLIWSLEMGTYELAARMLAALAALEGQLGEVTDKKGNVMDAGFEVNKILRGEMDEDLEAEFFAFMKRLNSFIPGDIVIRAIDDPDFTRRNVRQLEADIKAVGADVVVVDPIYYMSMERNESQTAGGDVSATSKKLRLMAGRLGVVMHVITQAEEVKDDEDEQGERKLRAPKRAELKKAKQILEDSSNTFAIDSCDGRGIIEIGKGRSGGEGQEIEVTYLPQYGIVKEIRLEQSDASMFAGSAAGF